MAFYNKNIRAPSEGRFNSRRAYTFNGSGGASFGTVITRNVIIFIYIKNDQLFNNFYFKFDFDIDININININIKNYILNIKN